MTANVKPVSDQVDQPGQKTLCLIIKLFKLSLTKAAPSENLLGLVCLLAKV